MPRNDYSYFMRLNPGAHVGQNNPLIVEAFGAPFNAPIAGTWNLADAKQNSVTSIPTSHFTFVEILGGAAIELTIDPAFYDDLTAPDANTWVELELEYDNGTPSPVQRHIQIYPRLLESEHFLFINGATQASQSINAIVPGEDVTWTWSVQSTGGLGPAELGFSTALNGQQATLTVTSPPDWTVTDAPFLLVIESQPHPDGTTSRGEFDATVTLRESAAAGGGALGGYTWWRGQVAGGPGLSTALDPATAVTISNFQGTLPAGIAITLDDSLSLTSVTAPAINYDETGTFDLEFQQGSRPASTLTGVPLNLRALNLGGGTTIDIPFEDAAGSEVIGVTGSEDWNWLSLSPSGGVSALGTASTLNDITLSWAQHALDPGASGALEVEVQLDGGAHPSSRFSVDVNIGTPAMGLIEVSSVAGGGAVDHTLQTGRERLRWQDRVYLQTTGGAVLPLPTAGQTLEFFVLGGAPIEFAEASKTDSSADPIENVLRTPLSSSADKAIPDGWAAASPQTITVRVVLRDATGVLAGGNNVDLSLPVQATADLLNVAILIDRSGSMKQFNRWEGAVSGAHWFANQVATDTSDAHQVGVHWFSAFGPGIQYPSPNPPGSPTASYGVLTDPDTGTSLTFTDFAAGATDWLAALGNTITSVNPMGWTAMGAGLLHARDELHALDPAGNAAQRVVLVLSDGQENREPLIAPGGAVFTGGMWSAAMAPLYPGGDPNTRVYSAALATTDDWVDVLRYASESTGGIPELDVKSFTNAATAGVDIGVWFAKNFAELFGFSLISAPPDPALGTGDVDSYDALVTHGHNKLIFTLFQNAVGAEDEWQVLIEPPASEDGDAGTLDLEQLAAMDGAEVLDGPMYRSVVINLPLDLEGQGFRWAGVWKMHVTRTGAGEANYSAIVMAKEDVGTRVVIDSKPNPRVGDPICVRAFVAEGAIDADRIFARTVVSPAESWRGALLAELITDAESPAGLPALPDVDADADEDADKDLRQDVAAAVVADFEDGEPRPPFSIRLDKVDEGIYEGCFTPDAPGTWTLDTTVQGYRVGAKARELSAKISAQLKAEARRSLRGSWRRDALETISKGSGRQAFRIEERHAVSVRFVADAKQSKARGWFVKKTLMRLSVRPTAHDGTLLGPGWASRIRFTGHRGLQRYEVQDAGNGTYWVDLELETKGELYHSRGWVSAESLALVGPRKRVHRVPSARLNLDRWGVEVLGQWMPLKVKGRLAAIRKDDPHLRLAHADLRSVLGKKVIPFASKDKADQAVFADLMGELRPALGQELPVRPSTRNAWAHGLKLALNATERAVNRMSCETSVTSLSALVDALERALLRVESTEAEDFGRCAEDFDALIDAVRELSSGGDSPAQKS